MARKYLRVSPTPGAALSIAGLTLGVIAWQLAPFQPRLFLKIILLLFAWFTLWFFSHDLTHHIVGKLGGIRVQYYFLGRSAIRKLKLPLISHAMELAPILVLKLDKNSMRQASPRARRWMHASGAIVSMLLPLMIIPTSYSIGLWVGILFTLLVVGNDLFTLYFSPKTGDLYRARMVKD